MSQWCLAMEMTLNISGLNTQCNGKYHGKLYRNKESEAVISIRYWVIGCLSESSGLPSLNILDLHADQWPAEGDFFNFSL